MKKLSELMKMNVDVSNRTILRVFAIGLGFVLAAQFVMSTQTALLLIFVAFFLAIALNPPVTYLARKLPRHSRGIATAIVYLAVLAVVVFLASSLVPPIVRQTGQLIEAVPQYIEDLQNDEGFLGQAADYFELEDRSDNIQSEVLARVSGTGEPVVDFLSRIFSNIISTLTVMVLTFFMLVEAPRWVDKFWKLHPKAQRKKRQKLANQMYSVITSYVNGQLLIATINGVATLIVLLLLGVPYAMSLAAIVAIFGLIPVIGATIGAVVVVSVGLFQSLTIGIILAIYFIVYQQLENNVIQPAIQSKSLGMSPLLILVSVIIGINLAGILGGLLAIPVMGSIRVLVVDYIDSHNLENA